MKNSLAIRPQWSFAALAFTVATLCCLASTEVRASSYQPALVYPANHGILYCPGTSITLRWTGIDGMNTYFVDVASDAAMTHHLLQKVVQFDTSISLSIGTTASTFYWTVSTGVETSPIGVFDTQFAAKVQLSSIYGGVELPTDLVHFVWVADPAAQRYTLELSNGAESKVDTVVSGTECSLVLPRQQMMYWKVRSECSAGYGEWSLVDSVRVAPLVNELRYTVNDAQISVYPQPAHDVLVVALPDNFRSEDFSYSVVDLLGRALPLQALHSDNTAQLLLHALSPGCYTLRMESATKLMHLMISIR